jgi:hypothetical protein
MEQDDIGKLQMFVRTLETGRKMAMSIVRKDM